MNKPIAALLLVATALTLVAGNLTSASSVDRVTSSGNSATAAVVPAPTALTACLSSPSTITCDGATTTDGSTVRLFWTAATGATGYRVYRSTTGAPGSYLAALEVSGGATVAATDSNPHDTAIGSAPPCSACWYEVRALYTTDGANWESQTGNPTAGPVKPLDRFAVVLNPAGTKTSGIAFPVDVTAQAADGSTVSNFVGGATFSLNNPTPPGATYTLTQPVAPFTFVAGQALAVSTNITTMATSLLLTATGGFPARTGSATVNFALPSTALKLSSPDATTNTLVTAGATGSRFLDAKTDPANFTNYTWNSTATATVSGTSGWALTLKLQPPKNKALNSHVSAKVWVDSSATCGTGPTAGTLLGSSALFLVEDLTNTANLVLTFNIPLSPGTASPLPQTGTICLNVANSDGNSGGPHDFTILTDGTSLISGAFTQP